MSNIYPVWWDKTLTLYNKHTESNGEVTWYRTTLNNCFWKYTGDEVRVNDAVLATKDTTCRIPVGQPLDYLPKDEWDASDSKDTYFTLGRGDILVLGEVDDTISEYTRGERSTDLLNKYRDRGCIEINEYRDNTGAGRVDEHYLVRGI